jgi:Kdo2-lipid IVA lauroyltransferase/acyltransferase
MTERLGERSAYLATRIGLRAGTLAVKLLPRRWLYRVSDVLANLAFYLFRGFRTRSLRNATIALGEKLDGTAIREIVYQSLRNFFRDFVEIGVALTIPGNELRLEIPVVGRKHLDEALTKGNGIIILSAHLGNFFLLGTRLALEGYPIHVLINQPRGGRLAKLMDDYRLKVQQQTIHARPRRDALRRLGQVLKRNEIAVVIADEYRSRRGIRVSFFGRTAVARRGPATLALRTGAAVIPAYLLRDADNHLKLIIEPELKMARDQRNKMDIRENTISATQWLERTVRTYPDQWNWMNIHWQDAAESSVTAKQQSVQRVSY